MRQFLVLTLFSLGFALSPAAAEEGDVVLGERLFNEGTVASGQPIEGTILNDVAFSGAQFSCASCHRRSGFGSSEGGNYVPPVTGPILFEPRRLDRAFMFRKLFKESQPKRFWSRLRQPRMRPAYTAESLARALRKGIDPAGRALSELMPRYDLPDRDMANLISYVKGLSTKSDPGIDDEKIYFATIVTENADPGEREAMLATMRKFFEWMNLDTRGDLKHPNFSPNYRSDFTSAYRLWVLDVWELKGEPDTWGPQLRAYYEKQPVFSLISGLIEGPWRPIHRFCERQTLPCLFPHTQLPVVDEPNRYSVHFTRGLTLEAQVLGRFLLQEQGGETSDIVQLYHASPKGSIPARALESMLGNFEGIGHTRRGFRNALTLKAELDKAAASMKTLVLWPGREELVALEWLMRNPSAFDRVFLPAAVLEKVPERFPQELSEKLYFIFPNELPSAYHPRAFRVRAWMHSRSMDISHPRLQFNTYYALTLVQFGLEHIVNDFTRDYLLEYVEHEAENALNPGTYPRLSLGPGQRFASKGAYIVKLISEDGGRHHIAAASDWIVP